MIKWTNEKIKEEIFEIKNALNLDRMPTRSEMLLVTRNHALANKISKTKGYYGWAEELNLSIKDSETTLGKKYEEIVYEILEEKGFIVDRMSQNYPFDLLINNNIKIDVKTAKPYKNKKVGKWHTFNLEKKFATCDIYVCVCLTENEDIERILVIPSKELKITQLSVGKESVYNKYIDRYDFIEKYNIFYNLI